MKKSICMCLVILLLMTSLPACRAPSQPVTREIFAMDTIMTITVYGKEAEKAADAAVEELNRLDHLWSVGRADSEVSRINREGAGTISPETEEVVSLGLRLFEETDGALDITIYPLMELWGFTGEKQQVPEEAKIRQTLEKVDAGSLVLEDHALTLGDGQGIDLGAIGKGYASTRVMEVIQSYNIQGAILSLGGNVQCGGKKPGAEEGLFKVGVQKPEGGEGYLGILSLSDKAVITSGGYERYFEENGKTYHHILDPSTGYPAESGLKSVTVISENGALADGLSTACFVMGAERSLAYWKEHTDEFDLLLYTEKGELYATAPLRDQLTSDMEITYVEP